MVRGQEHEDQDRRARRPRRAGLVVALFIVGLVSLTTLAAGCGGEDVTSTLASTTTRTAVATTAPPATSTTAPPTTEAATTTVPAPSTSTTRRPTPSEPVSLGPGTGREFARLPVEAKVVALTFDAAYDPAPLQRILAALDAGGATGTFFLTGEFVEDFPDEVRRIQQAGYPVGNHSYNHPDFLKLGQEEIASQLRRTARLLADVGVPDPRPLFRFPFGSRNDGTLARIGREGYDSIYWTIDTLDWKPERTTVQIRASVLDNLRPGAIVLMHVGSKQTAGILPTLINDLRERGYRFVTVPQGLAVE